MPAPTIVFVSDIHVGSNTRTNWYQRDLHEPFLLAIFDHVREHADTIAELVILGDLVDQWTYLPHEPPPSVADIFAANPKVFGPGGALAGTVAAVDRVTYMPGNHDMGITGDDLAGFAAPSGRSIRMVNDPIYQPRIGHDQIVCTHGHIYSMLNAPDFTSDPEHGLPIGHYVTRLCALYAENLLGEGQTVADLRLSGDPTGAGLLKGTLRSLLKELRAHDEGVARLALDAFREDAKAPPDIEFVMHDGARISAEAVARKYGRMNAAWHDKERCPPHLYGHDPGGHASEADISNDLSHFARVLGDRFPVVVMGHTHVPHEEGLYLMNLAHPLRHSIYVNNGFSCPSKPDMADPRTPHIVTFTEVEIDDATRHLRVKTRHVEDGPRGPRVADEPLHLLKIRMR